MAQQRRQKQDEMQEFEDVKCVGETTLAIQCQFPSGRLIWVPKSQVGEESEVYEEGGVGTLVIKKWFAEKEHIE